MRLPAAAARWRLCRDAAGRVALPPPPGRWLSRRRRKKKEWALGDSIFAPRKNKEHARAFFNTPKLYRSALAKDWARLRALERRLQRPEHRREVGGGEARAAQCSECSGAAQQSSRRSACAGSRVCGVSRRVRRRGGGALG